MNHAIRVSRLDAPVAARPADAGKPTSEVQLGLAWLLKVRWVAVFGQLVALAIVSVWLRLELPYVLLLGLVAFAATSNAMLTWLGPGAPSARCLPGVLTLDVVLLTAMLAVSGGASNPFTVFYLVHVALAALLLDARIAWAIVVLTIVAFGGLFLMPGHRADAHDHGPWSAHLAGMWVAYALAAGFVAHFVGRVSRAIRDRDRRVAELANLAAQNERLATLSSFSANAAHELGSPLATIGLAAKELSIGLRRDLPSRALAADAELVCREVARCRDILADLSARAGESVGEMPVRTTTARVVAAVHAAMAKALQPHLVVTHADEASATAPLVAPPETLAQMLHNLIRNAFDAQEEAGATSPVELHVAAREHVCFHVLDRGAGLVDAVRARLGEPFVTTKADRGGLGLGVYLARAYAERTGGSLRFQAREGGGCDVQLCLPRDAVRGGR